VLSLSHSLFYLYYREPILCFTNIIILSRTGQRLTVTLSVQFTCQASPSNAKSSNFQNGSLTKRRALWPRPASVNRCRLVDRGAPGRKSRRVPNPSTRQLLLGQIRARVVLPSKLFFYLLRPIIHFLQGFLFPVLFSDT